MTDASATPIVLGSDASLKTAAGSAVVNDTASSEGNATGQTKNVSFTSLIDQLTLEEKVSLLAGRDFASTTGVERLNIPSLKTVDSVNGVKGSNNFNGTATACFPSTSALGSTWNIEIMEEMGRALAQQAKLKSASVILGPTMNIHRDPRGGRNFECFSEDPFLTGSLGGAIVNGIQAEGVAACPKHFVANDAETKRRQYDVTTPMDGRTMREIYMSAFQQLLRNSEPMGIMTAYNKINGLYSCDSPLIKEVLRKDWGFAGLVMSDWFGTKSGAAAIEAGLDLEMPGPTVFRGAKLVEDVRNGVVSEALINERVSKMLTLIEKTIATHSSEPEQSVIDEHTNLLARRIASEGIVLVKNENNTLPLALKTAPKIALVGASATNPPIGGGGSASAPPQYLQNPFELIKKLHSQPDAVKLAGGVKVHNTIPLLPASKMKAANGESGINVSYFNNGVDEPVLTEYLQHPQVVMLGRIKDGLKHGDFRYEMSTSLTPETTGLHTVAIQSTGNFSLFVDGIEVMTEVMTKITVEDFLFVPENLERRTNIHMIAGKSYDIRVVVQPHDADVSMGEPQAHSARICLLEEYSDMSEIFSAISLASVSDTTIIFAGRTQEHESEGFDLKSIKLPQNQVEMIKYVAAASKKTVLVLSCGNPIDVSDFVDDVDAILVTHFLGQEGGQAVVDIIAGVTCPSGKLAVSWPKRLEDTPSFGNFPPALKDNRWEVDYAEGLKVGYRNDRADIQPRWPFGFGLSYTSFAYSGITIQHTKPQDGQDSEVTVEVQVSNTGASAGSEVVQLYVEDVVSSVWRPKKELKGFKKIWLEAGEVKTVNIAIKEKYAFSFWDEKALAWKAEAGEFRFHVGGFTGTVILEKDISWSGL